MHWASCLRLIDVLLSPTRECVFAHKWILNRLAQVFLYEREQFSAKKSLARSVVAVHLFNRCLAQKLNDIERTNHSHVSLHELKNFLQVSIVHATECAFWVGHEYFILSPCKRRTQRDLMKCVKLRVWRLILWSFLARVERIHEVFSLVSIEALKCGTVVVFSWDNMYVFKFVLGFGVLVYFKRFLGLELEFFYEFFPTCITYFLPTLCKLFLALKRLSAFFKNII